MPVPISCFTASYSFDNASRKVNNYEQKWARLQHFAYIGKIVNLISPSNLSAWRKPQFSGIFEGFSTGIWLPVGYFRLLNRETALTVSQADSRV